MSKAQLAQLIDLPDGDLQQVLDYASTLTKAEAVEHFKNLLGDEPPAIEFISAFNAKRQDPAGAAAAAAASAPSSSRNSDADGVPKQPRGPRKKKKPLHTPPARQVANLGPPPGAAYNKKDLHEDYISGRSGTSTPLNRAGTPVSGRSTPSAKSATPPPGKPAKASSAGGSLIQDALLPKSKGKSNGPSGKASSSSSSVKVSIAGGTAMHGAATALSDFDAAIRSLEVTTNPTLSSSTEDAAGRRCHCVATRHALQTAAPNCLRCGKVVCVKEGLGPCTFCGTPLLSAAEVQAMIKELRAERGREKMAADKAANRRGQPAAATAAAGASGQARGRPTMIAGTTTWGGDDGDYVSPAEAQARAHRDKLLGFQAQNAQRTTVRDEAADFDVGDAMNEASSNIWASPVERARALKAQQKRLRELEWQAKPAYETRQQVLSIDLAGKKVFRRTVAVERPPTPDSGSDGDDEDGYERGGGAVLAETDANRAGGGAFSRNPLLGGLIRPVYEAKDDDRDKGKDKDQSGSTAARPTRWRRVQDDLENNEAVILDGGIYGGQASKADDEPGCG